MNIQGIIKTMAFAPFALATARTDFQCYKTKIGKLILGSFDGKLCVLDFEYRKIVDSRIKKNLKAEFVEQDTQGVVRSSPLNNV
jgi:hypothetical protein